MASILPILTASMIAVAGSVVVLIGLMGGFRRREMSIVDYPELPPPSGDKSGAAID